MEIKTKEMPKFKFEDITKVYSGKEGSCMCGCAGKYFYTKLGLKELKSTDYRIDMYKPNPKMVKSVFNKMKKIADVVGLIVLEDYIIYTDTGRNYTIYLKETK
jgi:hypothetical protein